MPLMAHASTHFQVPPQPWGLPPDAALLNTGFGSGPLGTWNGGSKGYRAATTGGISAQPSPRQQQSFNRWSASGIVEQRLLLGQGSQAAPSYGASRVTSPVLSETDTLATVIAGSEGAVLVPGQSRPISSTEAAIAAAIEEQAPVAEMGQVKDAFFDQTHKRHGFFPIPPHVRGWARVRWAYHSKELFDLPRRESYDVVSATFKRLFPQEFDRAIPVINHRGVDKLLLQWEATVAALERAELKRRRTGREPLRLTGKCGPLLGCCAESIGCGCCPWGMSCMDEESGACWPAGSAVKIIPELQVCLLAAIPSAALHLGQCCHKCSMLLLLVLAGCACCADMQAVTSR
jgi:hypothetical protein